MLPHYLSHSLGLDSSLCEFESMFILEGEERPCEIIFAIREQSHPSSGALQQLCSSWHLLFNKMSPFVFSKSDSNQLAHIWGQVPAMRKDCYLLLACTSEQEFSSLFKLLHRCLLTVKMQSVPNKHDRFMFFFFNFFFSLCLEIRIKLIIVWISVLIHIERGPARQIVLD